MQVPLSVIRNSLLSKTGGRAQANIPNLYSLLMEAAWTMMMRTDGSLPSAIRVEPFISPLYTDSKWIVLPDDFTLDGLIAVRPENYADRTAYVNFINPSQFNREQLFYTNTITQRNGVQFLQTKLDLPAPTVINTGDNQTDGTWVAVGDSTNVRVDTTVFMEGRGSIAFDTGASADNGVQNLSMTGKSITGLERVLIWLDSPIALTSGVRVTVGSDTSNYYEQVLNSSYFNQELKQGFNLLALTLETATQVGTVNTAGITYVKVEILDTVSASLTFRIDGVLGIGDEFINLEYYSNSIFVDQYGHRKYIPTADTDSILLSEKEYILFLRQFAEIANVDVQPTGAATQLAVYGGNNLLDMYTMFSTQHPSRKVLQADSYSSGRSGGFFYR